MKTILKKNKALFILPLVLLPFAVLIFYILGGGEEVSQEENPKGKENRQGANYELPHAEHSLEIYDKLEAYQKQGQLKTETRDYHVLESKDSTRTRELLEDSLKTSEGGTAQISGEDSSGDLLAHIRKKEQSVRKELKNSNSEPTTKSSKTKNTGNLPKPEPKPGRKSTGKKPVKEATAKPTYTGIDELDKVFKKNTVLTRKNDSLQQNLKQAQERLLAIEKRQKASFVLEKKENSGFEKSGFKSTLIKAEIYETTTVLDGNRVKLRMLEDTWLEGNKITRNQFVYGTCKTANERLYITITQIPVDENFMPVELTVLDLDGLPGLYVPDNAARKVTKEVGSGTSTSSLFGTTDNALSYIGLRAADRTAQTLLKRVRLKKVTVKKNTLVYLKNQNQMP